MVGRSTKRFCDRPVSACAQSLESRVLLSAGDLDPGFGVGGLVTTDFPGTTRDSIYSHAIAVQADGKSVVVGTSTGSSFERLNDFRVTRFNTNGTLDTTFGVSGQVSIDFGGRDDDATSVAITPDGRIVVAGKSGISSADELAFAFVRLNVDGSLDSTFDNDGRQLLRFPGVNAGADNVAVAADGSVAAAGRITDFSQQPYFRLGVARLRPDGSPDLAFGGGTVQTAVARERTDSQSIRFDANGRIVVAAYALEQSGFFPQSRSLLLRYKPDGSLDPQFGTGGIFSQPAAANVSGPFFTDFSIDHQGRIVVAGYAPAKAGTRDTDFWVARLLADGSFDPSFGDDGSVTLAYQIDSLGSAGSNDVATAVFCRPDDSIVVVGTTQGGRNELPRLTAVAHISTAGQLDSSFGDFGWAVGGSQNGVIGADLAPDGKATLLVGGVGSDTFNIILEQFTKAGKLDPAFGPTGRTVTQLKHGADDAAVAVLVQTDEKTVVAGRSQSDTGRVPVIVRYLLDGSLDPTFGNGGRVVGVIPQGDFEIRGAALQTDGKIVVGGTLQVANEVGGIDYLFAAARLRTDGTLDPTFGTGGYAVISFDTPRSFSTRIETAQALVLRSDGTIVLVGSARSDVAMARLDSSGHLDPSFGDGGKVVGGNNPSPGWESYSAAGAVIGPAGTLVVAVVYRTDIANRSQLRLVRYDSAGDVDPTFDTNQTIRSYINAEGVTLATDSQDAILVGGGVPRPESQGPPAGQDFYIARYHVDGTPDTFFGVNGETWIDFAGGNDVIRSLIVRPNGSILAAGRVGSTDGSPVRSAVASISQNGQLDPTFGQGGWVTTGFGAQYSEASSIAFSATGLKFVTAGSAALNGGKDLAVARYSNTNTFLTAASVFYNNSAFDGHDAAASAADDAAIAQVKRPFLGYGSGPNNISNFSKGINGVMFDVLGLSATTISADDFSFTTGRDSNPATWLPGPLPQSITIRRGAGIRGTDRVTLIWRDYDPANASPVSQAVANGWLHIGVNPGGALKQESPTSFTIGNLIGETGGDDARVVNAVDLVRTRNAIGQAAGVDNAFDMDHSGVVNATDIVLVRNALGHTLSTPQVAPPVPPSAMGSGRIRPAAARRLSDEIFGQTLIDFDGKK